MRLALGYTYEKFEQDDILINDYDLVVDYLSGAYADMDYEANVGYVSLNYRF